MITSNFSNQRTTNILLAILVVAIFLLIIRLEIKSNDIEKSLNYIGNNTDGSDSYLKGIENNTEFLGGYLEAIQNNTRYLR